MDTPFIFRQSCFFTQIVCLFFVVVVVFAVILKFQYRETGNVNKNSSETFRHVFYLVHVGNSCMQVIAGISIMKFLVINIFVVRPCGNFIGHLKEQRTKRSVHDQS